MSAAYFAIQAIPQFMMLMWGRIKNVESKNCGNRGYLVAIKGRKIG